MKKVKKIYGVYGMMEYQAIILIGKRSHLRVNFTEGSATAVGQTPATYTTDNIMFQHAIENSADFKKGRIKLIKTLQLDEDVYIESDHVKLATKAAAEATDTAATAAEEKSEEATATAETTAETTENDQETTETTAEAAETADGGTVVKEFSCNDDAKDYFEEAYGVKRSSIRTRAEIVAYGESVGVTVVFTD